MSSRRRTAPILGSLPADEGARRVLVQLSDAIESTWEGAASAGDPEDLHRFRIAVRQARSVLGVCRALVRDDVRADGRSMLGALSDLTGPPRDLDVIVTEWTILTGGLDETRRNALDPLRMSLDERRTASHHRLAAGLTDGPLRSSATGWSRS